MTGNLTQPSTRLPRGDAALVGSDILNLITTGLHTHPLSLFREYIQNSADSMEPLSNTRDGRVDISINPVGREVIIFDNGPGLSYQQAKNRLIPIAQSGKKNPHERGFRGIGRLSGMGFARTVTFLTRSKASALVTKVVWNRDELKACIQKGLSLDDTVARCVSVEKLKADNAPEHFFEVRIEGIHRHAASQILNADAVRKYISERCPVPFSSQFPYQNRISKIFDKNAYPLELTIYCSNEGREPSLLESATPIERPHGQKAALPAGRSDDYTMFEKIEIPSASGDAMAAKGWIAHTSYHGALSSQGGFRGLRARVGNIQIGDETVFDHLFSENRFNRWCVGEVHILDHDIVPNGTRDYFEMNVHLRNLENHLAAHCRGIEKKCRDASRERNRLKRLQSLVEDLEAAQQLASNGYLPLKMSKRLIEEGLSKVDGIKRNGVHKDNNEDEYSERLAKLKRNLNSAKTKGPRAAASHRISKSRMSAYKSVFGVIADLSPTSKQALETIETILKRVES